MIYRSCLIVAALILLTGCTVRTDKEEQIMANGQASMWEAAEAIRIGKDPAGPILVIQRISSASASALGHPYPVLKGTP